MHFSLLAAYSKFTVCFAILALTACAHRQVNPPVAQVVPTDQATASIQLSEGEKNHNRPEISDRDEKRIDDVVAKEEGEVDGKPMAAPTPEAQEALRRSDYHKLNDIKKIWVSLAYATVRIQTGVSKKNSEAKVKVFPPNEKSPKSDQCSAHFETENGELRIVETKTIGKQIARTISGALKLAFTSIPTAFDCRYEVEIDASESIDIGVKLVRGSVFAENWKRPLAVELDWGDIDVGNIGPLNVNCGRCTVAGEDVAGPFSFKIANGNIGIVGLQNGAEGETLGDLVLKWKRLPSNAEVKLKSRAGDVVLGLPKAAPVSLDLKTPRGEVYAGKITSLSGGIPLDVSADIGNIRLYRY